jgi:hypothetical protein
MPTTVTIEKNAEYLRWPPMCVCCGAPDEVDVEVIAPDTSPGERDLSAVSAAHIPHCLECEKHSAMGFSIAKIAAIALALLVGVPVLVLSLFRLNPYLVTTGSVAALAVVIAVDRIRVRGAMTLRCAASGPAYRFAHPSNDDVTTITFANDHFARAFRAVNLGGVYEV